jgi:thiol-disulfide isomerase/thioredoxin
VARIGRLWLVLVALATLHGVALTIQVVRDERLDSNPLGLEVERLVSGRREALARIAGGRPLLIVFWTTWCEYCAEELEGGAGLVERLSTGSVPARVLFVNVREHASTVASYPAIEGLTGRIGLDRTGQVARAFGVRGYPSRVLLGSDGEVLWTSEGLGDAIDREVLLRIGGLGEDP